MHMVATTFSLLFAGYAVAQVPQGGSPLAMGAGGAGLARYGEPMYPAELLKGTGTGKYPAHFFSDPGLPKHTIYAPKSLPPGTKTPLLVWGNGGCMNNGLTMAPFLFNWLPKVTRFLSTTADLHLLTLKGVTVLSNGMLPKKIEPPTINSALAAGQTLNENTMALAIDWAERQKGTQKWAHLDTAKIAAGGQSCGGMEALVMTLDKRVMTIGVFNSGSALAIGGGRDGKGAGMGGKSLLPLPNKGVIPNGSSSKVPTFLFLGGKSDVASAKGNRDYGTLPAGVPGWISDYSKNGHAGTYSEANGGAYGKLASHWLNFVFFGNKESAEFFKQDKPASEGWLNIEKKNLDKIPVV